MHKLQRVSVVGVIVPIWHYIATQSDLIAFIAILAIYKEYQCISQKKNKQIEEKQENAQKLRMNWHILNQTQDKLEKTRQ